ncbi:MAG: inorganic diphosphatase, partial [Bacteroidota bacterium]
NHIESREDVPPHLLREIEHFFQVYKDLEDKKTGTDGWYSREVAKKIIKECRERYLNDGRPPR